MTTDVMQGWSNFLVGELGAAAALTGLLFVAEALLALTSVMFVTRFALVPRQSAAAYGVEIGATGLLMWAIHTVLLIRSRKLDRQYVGFLVRFAVNQLPPLPFVVSGVVLIAGRSTGVDGIVPGVLLSLAAGVFGAWVLLVEIQP
jgi:hypothetical protein